MGIKRCLACGEPLPLNCRIPDQTFSQATIERDGVLVRINPDAPGVPRSLDVPIAGRAEATLAAIDEVLGRDCC